jgi:hypothetical protein
MTAVVQREMGRGPRGERWQSTGRRGKALADDGGALVEVNGGRGFAKNGEALVEDCMVVRGAATLGEDGGGAPVRNFGSLTAKRRLPL